MKVFKSFFECFFNQTFYFDDLDKILKNIKQIEYDDYRLQFITELHAIIQTKNYKLASKIIKKYGSKILNIEETERVLSYIYDILLDKNVILDTTGFYRNCKAIFCPLCCPDPEKIKTFSLIEKATIIENNQQIYICKPCKAVWASEDIRADNAQNYKTFMKSIGLKGFWIELRDIDVY